MWRVPEFPTVLASGRKRRNAPNIPDVAPGRGAREFSFETPAGSVESNYRYASHFTDSVTGALEGRVMGNFRRIVELRLLPERRPARRCCRICIIFLEFMVLVGEASNDRAM